jgi:hypothetical protein
VTTRGATLAALLAALARPAWWLLGLAGFLARGGIVLFLLAIVTLPSPLAISNVVAPLLMPIVFGGVTPALAALVATGIGSIVALVLVGALIGAATEVVLIDEARDAAVEEGVPVVPRPLTGRWLIGRVAIAHLLAHIPLVVVAALGSIQIVGVAYLELTSPVDVVTPLPLRIVGGAIAPILAIVVAWVVGEISGGLAARSIVLGGSSVPRSVSRAYGDLVSRPGSALLPGLLTTGLLALDLAAMLAAVALAWTIARSRLVEIPAAPVAIGLALASFAAIWCLALLVSGLIAAWRSVAMTFEAERVASADALRRAHPDDPDGRSVAGTFGAPANSRPGDWSAHNGGGSL